MRDFEDFLRGSGVRWRAIHRPSHDPLEHWTGGAPDGPGSPAGRHPERPWLRLVGIAVLLPLVVVVALVVNGGSRSRTVSSGAAHAGAVQVAAPPLLTRVPPPTPAVQVAAGMAAGSAWSLWVKISSLDARRSAGGPSGGGSIPGFGPGLDMEVVTPDASGGGGGDPRGMDSLYLSAFGPTSSFGAEVVYGVTSARAASVQVVLSRSAAPLKAALYTDPHFPGLRFFTAVAPAAAGGTRIVAEALATDGTPFLATPPGPSSPPGG